MQYVKRMFFALCAMVMAIFSIPVLAGSEDAGERVMKGMGKVHVPFIANEGQVDERVAFYADTFGGTVYVTKKGEIVYSLPKYEKEESGSEDKEAVPHKRHTYEEDQREKPRSVKGVVLMEEIAEGFEADVAGGEKAETIVNYFKGNDPEQWRSNIVTYKTVSLGEIYPGVKLELKAYGNNVEKIFRVEPGIDPSVIQLKLGGATGLTVDEQGELAVETDMGPASFTAPLAYQYIEGKKTEVTAKYAIKKPDPLKGEQGLVYGFQVGGYDATKELIIDPLLASTYLGGSSYDHAFAIALDSSGNVYVAGYTYSSSFPTTSGAYDTSHNSSYDVFVVKLDSTLTSLQASTYLGGSSSDHGYGIALDGSGNVYVTGYTESSGFPTTSGAYDTTHNSSEDVFVTKLDSSLTSLQASTYLGGSSYDSGNAIALDGSGNVYVTGYTYSSSFPTTTGAYDTSNSGYDVFVTKLDSSLTSLQASTYLGGSDDDSGWGIALDGSGNVYVTGYTYSSSFPTTSGAYDTSYNSGYTDVFVSKLDSSLTSLQASTYLGGSSSDYGYGIALDGSGNVYVTGYTKSSSGFPTTSGAYDTSYNSYSDVFVSKLDSSLTSLQASTYLGGSSYDYGKEIALDSSGNVYVTGLTLSSGFPTTSGAYDTSHNSGTDVFVAKLDSSLASLQASTYLGGSSYDYGYGIAIDGSSNVYVTGSTYSSDFPTTSGAYDTSGDVSYGDVFVAKLDSSLSTSPPTATTGSASNITGTTATLNGTVNANGVSTTAWFEYGIASRSYSYSTTTQTVTGTSDTSVSASITGLSSGTTYYFRTVAENSVGKAYGDEASFTTLDSTAPSVSVTINGGADYTRTTSVTLTLTATDSTGIAGYYISTASTKPSASTVGWVDITSTTSYYSNVSYTLSTGDGIKTVYTWFKDTSGNVSDTANDSITLDTTAPTVTITSPTSSTTYTATGKTIDLGGTASDLSGGVSSVTWSSSSGESGTASGTTIWTISGITLTSGSTTITVTATDNAGNTSTDSITVTYTGAASIVTTGSATNVTDSSATLSGTVNASNLTTTAWFEYGIASGSYDNKTTTVTVTGSTGNTVTAAISGLSAGAAYYYRIAAQNDEGTTYGSENSFSTLDKTAPTGSLTINGGADYTNSTSVALTLKADDTSGVTGYYVSESSTTPSAASTGWTAVTSSTSYSAEITYMLSSSDGSKTIYAWFKDNAGNVSNRASDSITLDTMAPTVTITSPTSNTTYSATGKTIDLGGTASDLSGGVSSVTWSSSSGESGTAIGTTSWTISGITVSGGGTTITVTATDNAGNTSTDSITVTYTGAAPIVTTGSATNVTDSSATLSGTVNASNLTTTAWFEYGIASGSYDNKTTPVTVTGSTGNTVTAAISGLSAGATYYYRIAAQNDEGTTYGSENSFSTLDRTAPTGSVAINGGADYTNSASVTLSLKADDTSGVTGYYVSESSTTPSAASTGWTAVTSSTSYSTEITYMLSSSDGSKTIYAWFKDNAGNVSNRASDSITLDTTAPTVTITSPTSNDTYSTTSKTVNLGGTASDLSSGVSSVTWSSSSGESGTASGTTSWTISGITVSGGSATITVTATDNAGNTSTDSITITYTAGSPTVTTGDATNVTAGSATLNGTVNANNLATTVWFEYGVASGTYDSSTAVQSVLGSGDKAVTAAISGLSPTTTYYFRIAAQNSEGTTYGDENSFITTDSSVPVGYITINGGEDYTTSLSVILELTATDNISVDGYYISELPVTPLVTASGWTSVTPSASYSGNVPYTLSAGDGTKTVYAWFKDLDSNISDTASDSIMLDKISPTVSITSPTTDDTYKASSAVVALSGSASDVTSGVKEVTWSNSAGESGAATGTTTWRIQGIILTAGINIITVTATDNAGNTGTDTIAINYSDLCTIYGAVEDERGDPFQGVGVTLTGNGYTEETETDIDGDYGFYNLQAGDYTLTFETKDYVSQTVTVSVSAGDLYEVDTIEMTPEGEELGTIFGYVTDIYGDPIEDAKVKLKSVTGSYSETEYSDADGFFEFKELEADTYKLTAKKKRYKKYKETITLGEGEEEYLEIELRKSGRSRSDNILETEDEDAEDAVEFQPDEGVSLYLE